MIPAAKVAGIFIARKALYMVSFGQRFGVPRADRSSFLWHYVNDSETDTLVFRIRFECRPLYDEKGKPVPGRNIKTITGIELGGEGFADFEKAEAQRIAREYLKQAMEEAV